MSVISRASRASARLATFLVGRVVVVDDRVVLDAPGFDDPLLHAVTSSSANSENVATARLVVALTATRVPTRSARVAPTPRDLMRRVSVRAPP